MNTIKLNKIKELSGSGFQFEKLDFKLSGRIDFICSYHVMNENGYYDGYCYFRVIPLENDTNYKIKFIGKDSQYLKNKYYLKDFIDDTIYYLISI